MSENSQMVEPPRQENIQKVERREWVRYRSRVEVTCRLFGTPDDHSWPAELRDASAIGCGLLTGCSFARGSILEVRPANGVWELGPKLLVRVKNAVLQSGGLWQLGFTFVRQLTDQELQTLL